MEGESVLLCRYGELFLKSGNRKRWEGVLVNNVQAALAGVPDARVAAPHGRILVRVPRAHVEEAAARVERVFGLVSLSVARVVAAEETAIGDAAVAETQAAIERTPRAPSAGKPSFRIDANRADKSFPIQSME